MFSFFKRKKAPAPQESASGRDSVPGAPETQDAQEVAPVAPTELPDAWVAAEADAAAGDGAASQADVQPAAAEPVSEFASGVEPAPVDAPVQPPDAWSDRPDETADPLVRLDRSAQEAAPAASSGSWLVRLRRGLSRTGQSLGGLFTGVRVDENLFEELETALIMADAGVEATEKLLAELRARVRRQRIEQPEAVRAALRDILADHLKVLEKPFVVGEAAPMVVMIAGVNGAGKTTSIGKLAHALRQRQATVLLAAGDTFRAAAREQLVAWGARNGVTVIAQEGGDPAAVAFDAVNAGRARAADVVLVDTAGRLPTQLHLMEELKKIKRVIGKADPSAPHEILLVVDGNTGQNALAQIRAFDAALGLTGLVVTKLDGTAKGGTLAAVAAGSGGVRPVPVYWIGVGEGMQDLQPFVAAEFADALLGGPEPGKG
ncbi:signal recognition particle-docking protein FtsY [Castellaniella daejeonensis]|jgi:fused signal recognition particle receptor|uniref:Signal recognition particle receptor FtsY n=1 Tax=Castellaniella daejeonensis TaxID=659013 RepID=A0ABN0TNB7_9BURK